MKEVKFKLYSASEYVTDDDIVIYFEVQNNTGNPIQVLKWFSPLEGLRSDCLVVKVNQKRLPYHGIKVKRGTPGVENFIRLMPGESIVRRANLEEAYDLPLKGSVSVEFDASRLQMETAGGRKIKQKTDGASARVRSTFKINRSKKTTVSFAIGAKKAKKKGTSRAAKIATAKDPVIKDATEPQKTKIKAAHTNGYNLATAALASVANNPKYKRWFGMHTSARATKVKDTLGKVKAGLETVQFTYIVNGPLCEPNDVAYTFDGSDKIWVCSQFWNLGATGMNSQAGTVVHEHSHASALTDDHASGISDCEALAKSNPDKAIDNGDSYEYYSES